MIRTWIYLVILSVAACPLYGCPNGTRKKRGAKLEDLPEDLSEFFGTCDELIQAATAVLPSLRSVVDVVLRDLKWFDDIRGNTCPGERDTPECWIYALEFLIDPNSVFFVPTAQCMCKWAEEENIYPCWNPQSVGKQSIGKVVTNPNEPCPPPRYEPLTAHQTSFSNCLDRNIEEHIKMYPSVERFDGKSVTLFLRDHYTFCRSIPDYPYEHRNMFRMLYADEVCPREGGEAEWRHDYRQTFVEAILPDSSLGQTIENCDARRCSKKNC